MGSILFYDSIKLQSRAKLPTERMDNGERKKELFSLAVGMIGNDFAPLKALKEIEKV